MIRFHPLYLLFPLGALLLVNACSKPLEPEPLDQLTDEYAWDPTDSLGIYPRNFLHNIYSYLPNGYNRIGNNLLDAATDDAVPSDNGTSIARMTDGGYSPTFNPDDAWQENYAGIRRVNMFLERFPIVPMIDTHTKRWWTAEARFLRAMFYYELVKRYGGVPLIGDRLLTLDDAIDFPKDPFDACVAYIVAECDAIKDSLRADPVDDGNWGRITKGVALTLKAKALLLAASPLHNPQGDAERWRAAADALKGVIDLNIYALHNDFTGLFITRRTREIILARQRGATTDVETNNAPVGYQSGQVFSNGRTSPTQELVDAFSMRNGLPIDHPDSGYDPGNPYADRDPRFYATIFHNGMQWLGRLVETFEGGRDKPGGPLTETQTGYYMRKFMADFSNSSAYSNQVHNFIIFRYADILLGYAESLNEYEGPTPAVYEAVEQVRARAGLDPFALPAGLSQTEMREAIRSERRVELAFEEHRFWDLRRWHLAEAVYNQPLHGMRITREDDGSFQYTQTSLRNPFSFIAPKMYLYPIPFSEIEKNPNLIQNDGWN